MIRCLTAALVAGLLGSANLAAETLDQARQAIERREYLQAVAWLRALSDSGSGEASYLLGTLYADGAGVPQSDAETLVWLERAVQQRSRDAALMLAKMHISGFGVPLDSNRGLHYLELAEQLRQPEEPPDDCL